MTETKEQILERMTDLMPWRLADQIKPYILEAMRIHADQQLRLYGVVKPFVCNNCQSKEEKKLTTSTSECLKCGTLQSN